MALVATVVPCITWPIASGSTPALSHTRAIPFNTPTDESSGVEGTFAVYSAPLPVSTSSTSVNVPPTSTPSL
jgi:hypothetical protein